MKQTLKFLRALARHNDKAWFDAHKADYLEAKATIERLGARLIDGIRAFDDSIGPLSVADCTYRIYRDLRFSKDKAPYKTHMGIFIAKGGKKSGYSGYYFHVNGGGNHMVAIGDYMAAPDVLRTLREDIEMGGGDFRRIVGSVSPGLRLDTEGALKRVPKGFPADSVDAEYFKLKRFCLYQVPDDAFILAPDLADSLLGIFKRAKPFLDYVNRAIDFCREEEKEYFSSVDF